MHKNYLEGVTMAEKNNNREVDFQAKLKQLEKQGKEQATRLACLHNLRHNPGNKKSAFFVH